jgi:hypothetical protein
VPTDAPGGLISAWSGVSAGSPTLTLRSRFRGSITKMRGDHHVDRQTAAEILAAARRRFGAEGYERTTLRAVAADVGVDAALVIRQLLTGPAAP